MKKHNLYRAGDKELLAIEQAYHQTSKYDENIKAIIANLKTSLGHFEEKYKDVIQDYAPEIGILYYFLRDYVKAFDFLTRCPMPVLQDLTYSIADALHSFFLYGEGKGKGDGYEYLKKYDALYQERPVR